MLLEGRRASLIAQLVKNLPAMQKTLVRSSSVRKILRRDRLPTPVFLGFPCGSAGKKISLQCGRPGFDPWVGKIPWRRERLPTPVFWPRKFHGLYSPWNCKESDTTEQLSRLRGIICYLVLFLFAESLWLSLHGSP